MTTETRLPMVKVYGYGPAWGFPDISPFVVKVLIYLKRQGFPFSTEVGSPRKAPRGKLPYVEVNSLCLSDSGVIINYLESIHPRPLNHWLSPEQEAVSRAVQSMIEEHLYFISLCGRWQYEDGFQVYRPVFLDYLGKIGIPGFLRPMVAKKARKGVIQQAIAQGSGRLSREEHRKTALQIIKAVDTILGDKPFMFGDQPCLLDCTVGASSMLLLIDDFKHEVAFAYRQYPRLMAYGRRTRDWFSGNQRD